MVTPSIGSSAVTVADRGRPSMAANSPSSAPGPRTARTTSLPPSVCEETLTRPEVRTSTQSDMSPSVHIVAPLSHFRGRPAAYRA